MTYNFINESQHKDLNTAIDILFSNITQIKELVKKYIMNLKKHTATKIKIRDYDSKKSIKTDLEHNQIQGLFQVIYDIVNRSAIKCLDSKNEYKKLEYHIKYQIIVANNNQLHKLFALFLIMYSIEPYLTKKRYYVGIDYEFHKRTEIRLMQINMERNPCKTERTTSYIWIIKPDDLDANIYNILIHKLMRNTHIYKIMNGADSLDTPYMIRDLFQKNKTTIRKFFKKFIDLRYICEYYKANHSNDNHCNIYAAYLYFNVITPEKYELLLSGNEKILEACRSLLWEKSSPADDDIWNIQKLDQGILYYAVFDVIYLKYYFKHILKMSKQYPNFIKNISLIPTITQWCLLEKHVDSEYTEKLKQYVNPINNYYYYSNNQIYKLIDAYKYFSENLLIQEYDINISKLLQINYFRDYITLILKVIVYNVITKKYIVYISKGQKYNNNFQIESLYDNINKNKFKKLIVFFKAIHQTVTNNITHVKI